METATLSEILALAENPRIISIHGRPGTGADLVAGGLALDALPPGRTMAILLVGDRESVPAFLNKTMGIGLDFYSHLRAGSARIYSYESVTFYELVVLFHELSPHDLILLVSLDSVVSRSPEHVERALAWVARQSKLILVTVSGSPGGQVRSYADIQIDLSRIGRAVRLGQADSHLTVRASGTSRQYSLSVAARGLQLSPA